MKLGNEIILPPQLTCCSHTLNLIATTECKKILDNPSNALLERIYRSVFAKLNAFWNILSRSSVASDICLRECKCKFSVPIITRWNSQYDAVKKFLLHKKQFNTLFEKLKLQKLKLTEVEFLQEFIMIMTPLVFKLNWIPEYCINLCKELFLKEVDNLYCNNATISQTKQSTSSSSSDEDFFVRHQSFKATWKLLSYLENKSKELDILNSYPHIKQYNTSLPSSASVERLFSCGQQILIPRRNRLSR
ncbi:hypothetical protein ALC62_09298 [Cyphomyrmex costatus]|uniref:HAT C-terminal dimerisation domain-containing protein n=1 Tax=Cyphomyrmex costatus TaxID=456900 RepID=A0A151IFK9_9HYME|nr:hypothetical protein ALC62_09298 [Cyphomyrmex costatus]